MAILNTSVRASVEQMEPGVLFSLAQGKAILDDRDMEILSELEAGPRSLEVQRVRRALIQKLEGEVLVKAAEEAA